MIQRLHEGLFGLRIFDHSNLCFVNKNQSASFLKLYYAKSNIFGLSPLQNSQIWRITLITHKKYFPSKFQGGVTFICLHSQYHCLYLENHLTYRDNIDLFTYLLFTTFPLVTEFFPIAQQSQLIFFKKYGFSKVKLLGEKRDWADCNA